jgi:hypothetical protein
LAAIVATRPFSVHKRVAWTGGSETLPRLGRASTPRRGREHRGGASAADAAEDHSRGAEDPPRAREDRHRCRQVRGSQISATLVRSDAEAQQPMGSCAGCGAHLAPRACMGVPFPSLSTGPTAHRSVHSGRRRAIRVLQSNDDY